MTNRQQQQVADELRRFQSKSPAKPAATAWASKAMVVFVVIIGTNWESGQERQQNLQFLHLSLSCEKLSECRIFLFHKI